MQHFSTVIADQPNGNNWRVAHDPATQMYYLKNDNGNKLDEVFTKRVFAEARLAHYLLELRTKRKPSDKSQKQKQAEAEWQDKNSTSPSTDSPKD